jgi:hypothetical protein
VNKNLFVFSFSLFVVFMNYEMNYSGLFTQ